MPESKKNTPSARLRRSQIAAIQIAKKQVGLDDDTYRDLCEEVTGKRSSAKMNSDERGQLLDALRKAGAKRPEKRVRVEEDDKGGYLSVIKAIWLDLHALGEVRDDSDEALRRYVKRMTGIDHFRWLDGKKANHVINCLNEWRDRVESASR